MMELVRRGQLVRRRGIGTVVADDVIRRRDELTALYDGDNRVGRPPVTEVLEFSTSWVDERASVTLGLDPTTPLVYLKRLRSVQEGPMSIARNWLPPIWVDLDLDALNTRGLRREMHARGVEPAVVHQTVAARLANPDELKVLHTEHGHPMLTISHTSYDVTGTPQLVGHDAYRYDRYVFHATVYAS
jgi:DNA-binding GntR family transcriptional regulator